MDVKPMSTAATEGSEHPFLAHGRTWVPGWSRSSLLFSQLQCRPTGGGV